MSTSVDRLIAAMAKAGKASDEVSKALSDVVTENSQLRLEVQRLKDSIGKSLIPPQPGVPVPIAPKLGALVGQQSAPVEKSIVVTDAKRFAGAGIAYNLKDGGVMFTLEKGASIGDGVLIGKSDAGQLVNANGPGSYLEDIDFADNANECVISRVGAVGFKMTRVRFRTHGRYAYYNEGAKDILLEDIQLEDWGSDGIPGTADDDGGSTKESMIRLQYEGSGIIRRVRAVFRGGSNKACIRGDGAYILEDCYFSGANGAVALNPLRGMDGGQNLLLGHFRSKGFGSFTNGPQVRAAVFAAIRSGTTDEMHLARVVGKTATILDPADKTKTKVIPINPTDEILDYEIKQRRLELGRKSAVTYRNVTADGTSLRVEANSVHSLDSDCRIIGSKDFGWPITFGDVVYPWIPNAKDAIGFRLPSDLPSSLPIILCEGTRFINPKSNELFMNYNEETARKIIAGTFYVNEKRFDWRF